MDNWITMDNKKNVFIGSTPCYAADTASIHFSYLVMDDSAFNMIKYCENVFPPCYITLYLYTWYINVSDTW